MADTITIVGNVATVPEQGSTATGIPTLSFRMATNHRRPDGAGGWVDAGTNWFEIKTYRALAENAAASLAKGDPVIVTGRLKLREWEGKEGRRGLSVEIEAENIGQDLRRGRSVYHRMSHPAPPTAGDRQGDGDTSVFAGVGSGTQDAPAGDGWGVPGGTDTPF